MILLRLLILLYTFGLVQGLVGDNLLPLNPFLGILEVGEKTADQPGPTIGKMEKRGYYTSLLDASAISATLRPDSYAMYQFPINTSSDTISNYQAIVFISGNICELPDGWNDTDSNGLSIYYTFNQTQWQNLDYKSMSSFDFYEGYAQELAHAQLTDADTNALTLYLTVVSESCADCLSDNTWTYEVGISQSNLVFQWHNESVASVVDTDSTSLIVWIDQGNASSSSSSSNNGSMTDLYNFFIYDPEDFVFVAGLARSWCAMKQGASIEYNSSSAVVSSVYRGGTWKQQFYFDSLTPNTTYTGYMLENFGDSNGGLVFEPFQFRTMESDECTLIYDLDFCSEVTYSVPTLPDMNNVSELAEYYDSNAKHFYTNFSYALQQIPCDTEMDARFSVVKTCDDCAASYKKWLCSITIPRCSTRNITGYQLYESGHSRLDKLNVESEIRPRSDYYEVLPCIDMCNAIVRDCPGDFSFRCPQGNDSIALSYYWETGGEYPSCNTVGVSSSSS
ncbi:unnamed protein product [Kuraishia capsulata CBS 1993]|uniref:FZ domain-containing protein n=1 Tax=Kuraishia capsulata CBS 1993 TaxID=1382522 RepID=W6MHG7_9ASCO|nr:uncharacterized protein KUCA_T00001090001 [Kuraishia capsulata CBS 1993]CDK25123.1 unnamed protein product [Kuraishia capsulata CBS 1993]